MLILWALHQSPYRDFKDIALHDFSPSFQNRKNEKNSVCCFFAPYSVIITFASDRKSHRQNSAVHGSSATPLHRLRRTLNLRTAPSITLINTSKNHLASAVDSQATIRKHSKQRPILYIGMRRTLHSLFVVFITFIETLTATLDHHVSEVST